VKYQSSWHRLALHLHLRGIYVPLVLIHPLSLQAVYRHKITGAISTRHIHDHLLIVTPSMNNCSFYGTNDTTFMIFLLQAYGKVASFLPHCRNLFYITAQRTSQISLSLNFIISLLSQLSINATKTHLCHWQLGKQVPLIKFTDLSELLWWTNRKYN